MEIIKTALSENIAAIYLKKVSKPFALVDINNNDPKLIDEINDSEIENGIIYYTGT